MKHVIIVTIKDQLHTDLKNNFDLHLTGTLTYNESNKQNNNNIFININTCHLTNGSTEFIQSDFFVTPHTTNYCSAKFYCDLI